ncbi:MAG TPA: ATP-binding cassette domain-containing protein [Myxococcota bacterium]|nr:ATP-binding cassette domain-containing protein [Myxococcota bacterium]
MQSEATTRPLAIEAESLAKRFGGVVALDGVDLRVESGACFGLLGPNGAGKTTLVSILATLLRPSAGRARLLGRDVEAERAAVRRDVGIVFQEPSLDPELTAREHLDLHARLYHLSDRPRRVAEGLARAELDAHADRPVRGFSGGMKRRLEIARGLLHRPRVLFLDEPTLGLDPKARAAVWSQLREIRRQDAATLLLTTHSMEEADALCERVAILDRGRVVAEGAPEALKSALGGDLLVVALERAGDLCALLAPLEGVREVALAEPSAGAGAELRVTVADGPRRLAGILERLRPFGILEVRLHRPTLEHVFLHHTGHAFEPEPSEGEGAVP